MAIVSDVMIVLIVQFFAFTIVQLIIAYRLDKLTRFIYTRDIEKRPVKVVDRKTKRSYTYNSQD